MCGGGEEKGIMSGNWEVVKALVTMWGNEYETCIVQRKL